MTFEIGKRGLGIPKARRFLPFFSLPAITDVIFIVGITYDALIQFWTIRQASNGGMEWRGRLTGQRTVRCRSSVHAFPEGNRCFAVCTSGRPPASRAGNRCQEFGHRGLWAGEEYA